MLDQDRAPLLEALAAYQDEGVLRLHMPGHKGRAIASGLGSLGSPTLGPWPFDATEVPGLDDLHDPEGPIGGAQQLLAELYGAEASHFLVGGSTAGIVALMLATVAEGDRVVAPRHAHRSLLTGLILSGARPVWLEPSYDPVSDLVLGVPATRYTAALQAYSGVKAFWATSPTYQGLAPDLTGVARLAAEHRLPLLVDEAHGAHFPFNPRLPRPALRQGASAAVQSAHKTLGALTQSAWLHLNGGTIDRERLRSALRLVQSSSPSYMLMASLDGARRQMAGEGRRQLAEAIDSALWLRAELARLGGALRPAEPAGMPEAPFESDPTKVWLDVSATGLTGPKADRLLRARGLQAEMAGPRHLLLMLTLADDRRVAEQALERLTELSAAVAPPAAALRSAAATPPGAMPASTEAQGALWLQRPVSVWPEAELSPREAAFRTHRRVALRDCAGLIAAESLVPYPPGIPLVMPGERLSPEILEFVSAARVSGVRFQGAADPTLEHILVVP